MTTPKRTSRPKPLTPTERLGIRHSAMRYAIDHMNALKSPILVRDLVENADQIAIYLETGKPLVVVGVDERGNPAPKPVSATMKQIKKSLDKRLNGPSKRPASRGRDTAVDTGRHPSKTLT